MRSRLPIALFLFSILSGGIFYFVPWVTIVGRTPTLQEYFSSQGRPHLPPNELDHIMSARLWQSGPDYPEHPFKTCPTNRNFFDSPAVQNTLEIFQNIGWAIFGALVLCWAGFGFLHRQILARFYRRYSKIIIGGIIITIWVAFCTLVLLEGGIACDSHNMTYIRQVTLFWPTVMGATLGLGAGVGAILTKRRSARKNRVNYQENVNIIGSRRSE